MVLTARGSRLFPVSVPVRSRTGMNKHEYDGHLAHRKVYIFGSAKNNTFSVLGIPISK